MGRMNAGDRKRAKLCLLSALQDLDSINQCVNETHEAMIAHSENAESALMMARQIWEVIKEINDLDNALDKALELLEEL